MAAQKKLRWGIVGVSGIAGAHVNDIRHRDDVEFVALCDVNEEALTRRQQEWGFGETYTDWKDMFAKAGLDAVSICTPNFLHYKPTIDALNAGLHVMCEKPLAMNAKEGRKMVDLAHKVGKQLIIGFQHRFAPKTRMIKRAVDAGTLGQIMYARVWALRRRGIPNWGMFVRKDLQGGGPLIDIGVHAMEMAHYAMGSPKPVSASAATYTYLGNKDSHQIESQWKGWDYENHTIEDLATGFIRFDNGATMTIESMFAGHIGDGGMRFVLMGTEGGADQGEGKLFYDRDGYMFDATPAFMPNDPMFRAKMDNFVNCTLYGAENKAPGEDGLMIQKIVDALYQSAEKGKEVTIR